MATDTKQSVERINFRLPAAGKAMIERAAAVTGQSLTDFAKASLLRCAQEALDAHNRILLSQEDCAAFMAMLEKESEPTAAMKRAIERYKSRYIRRNSNSNASCP
ncbi:MAG: DUF1778 domain-containing protein [Desulfobacteraceae bacterium]|nr:MAG: DUF1778 domain-containing protein [Desulfobacteraceae bacterium]